MKQFRSADLDRNGAITLNEISKMLSQLNIVFDKHEMKALFEVTIHNDKKNQIHLSS